MIKKISIYEEGILLYIRKKHPNFYTELNTHLINRKALGVRILRDGHLPQDAHLRQEYLTYTKIHKKLTYLSYVYFAVTALSIFIDLFIIP